MIVIFVVLGKVVGKGATGYPACPIHGANFCSNAKDACKKGYTLEGAGHCRENICMCHRGTPARGGTDPPCPQDGQEFCISAHPGYFIPDKTAGKVEMNICICPYGTPATGSSCKTKGNTDAKCCHHHGTRKCVKCMDDIKPGGTKGWKIAADKKSCVAHCSCEHGDPDKGAGCPFPREKCKTCRPANKYKLDYGSRLCLPICTCAHGEPVKGGACTKPDEICRKCTENGWRLSGNVCKPVCTCDNGVGVKFGDERCGVPGTICLKCNRGFSPKGGSFPEKEACEMDVCTCKNGEGATDIECWKIWKKGLGRERAGLFASDRFQTGSRPVSDLCQTSVFMAQCLLPHAAQSMSSCHVRCTYTVMSDAQCHFTDAQVLTAF